MTANLPFESFLTAGEAVWVWDSDNGRIVWANPQARSLWGENDLDNLRRRRFSARSSAIAKLSTVAKEGNGNGQWSGALALPVPTGKTTVQCHVQRLQLADGARGCIVKAAPNRDGVRPSAGVKKSAASKASSLKSSKAVDEQFRRNGGQAIGSGKKLLAKARQPASAKAPKQAAAKAKRAFRPKAADMAYLAGLSHDLRNPFTAIIGFAEILKLAHDKPLTPEKIAEYADDILRSAVFGLDLANELMNYARKGPPETPQNVASASADSVVAECLKLIAPLAQQRELIVKFRLGAPLPQIRISARNLKQILLNVLLNSIKFSRDGGTICVRALRDRSASFVLAIDDDGGVHDDAGDREGRLTAHAPGAGLGLVMVKRLLKDAGAKMHKRARRNGGTSVKLIFPPRCLD